MAKRSFENQGNDHCGCDVIPGYGNEAPKCPVIKCNSECDQVIKIRKGESVRICVDYSDCGYCTDSCPNCPVWEPSKAPKIRKDNVPDCPDSEGMIGVESFVLDEKSGKFYMTFNAFDPLLQNRERFRVETYIKMPDQTVRGVHFYVAIGF